MSQVQIRAKAKTLGDFFQSVQAHGISQGAGPDTTVIKKINNLKKTSRIV